MESELLSILSADTNSDSDTDSIDTGIGASGILDYLVLYQWAFEIVVLEMDESADFPFVLPSSNDLVMVDNYSHYKFLLG